MNFDRSTQRIVFDLGGSTFRSAVVDETNNVRKDSLTVTETRGTIRTPEHLAGLIAESIRVYLNEGNKQERFVLSLAGPVAGDARTIIALPNILGCDYQDIRLSELVEGLLRKTGIEVSLTLINDGTAGIYGEMGPRGAARDRDEAFGLIVGTGVGGKAFFRQGHKLLPLNIFTELGHHLVAPESTEECGCGAKGCLETVAAGKAVPRIAAKVAAQNRRLYDTSIVAGILKDEDKELRDVSGRHIGEAARRNDQFAIRVLEEITYPVSFVVRNILVSHPKMAVVFIGGFALGVGQKYLEQVQIHLTKMALPFTSDEQQERLIREQVLLGRLNPDLTNLIGDRNYLGQLEELA